MSRAVDEFGRASHRLPQVWPFIWRKVKLQILYLFMHPIQTLSEFDSNFKLFEFGFGYLMLIPMVY